MIRLFSFFFCIEGLVKQHRCMLYYRQNTEKHFSGGGSTFLN
uniref:Uncharacterized protein n=1 Tax=Anguilla anguilla TaxID=7936 RepID=A0A0E9XYN6_ANGAN